MKIIIPKEIDPNEDRVAISPKNISKLKKLGYEVYIQSNAGLKAKYTDEDYLNAGAIIINSAEELYSIADIVFKVQPPTDQEINLMKSGTLVLSYLYPALNQQLLTKLAEKGINAVAMDAIPRISRAQKMDVLSSMSNIAGYRAVVEAAFHFGRFLNGQITAAGKVDPAKVLVIGTGVAGLAAIGTAKSLGTIVRAFDTRKETAEQVQSMGAQFITVDLEEDGSTETGYSKEMSDAYIKAELNLFKKQAQEVDIIITTAQIPGKEAPKLLFEDHVNAMKRGSVIVDLAAPTGGNCVLTKKDEIITTDNGITILGKVNMMPTQASYLYGNNLINFIEELGTADNFNINMDDDVIKRAMVVYNGKINWPPEPLPVSAKKPIISKSIEQESLSKAKKVRKQLMTNAISLIVVGICLFLLGKVAPPDFMRHITVFVLAIFVGWNVIWNVTHALHTPLMSVTNAISGIIIIGGLLQMQSNITDTKSILAFISILIACINIVGGFLVTYRMLKMFKK
ncbi:MAG: Re/Si-specific NAD(P)(+) transhydrogenase subunit alpha [Bacteroidales bacterium]|jgi:NAD(P) transhydrogenase subunit alpha|nr:Re/Si-specific NAD(P)(+) transhydrogenase subunit alpha [Bacteroidales bacterium]